MESIPVLINSILNASSLEALKGQLVVALTQVYENGGGGGGITSITSTDNSITIDNTDPSAPDLSIPNGTFTPTISGTTNDATVSISDCFYVKVGKWANLSFVLDCQMDVASSTTLFDITLPFTTDNISILTCSPQTSLVENITTSATGASVNISVQSMNAGDNIEKLEVSINFLLA